MISKINMAYANQVDKRPRGKENRMPHVVKTHFVSFILILSNNLKKSIIHEWFKVPTRKSKFLP
jgi:hypothetical protein